MVHICDNCGEKFEKKVPYNRHVKLNNCPNKEKNECKFCFKSFATQNNARRHENTICPVKLQEKDDKKNADKRIAQLEKENEKNEKIIKDLREKNKKLAKTKKKTKCNKNTTINNIGSINTITNNITLYAHGKEDLSKLPDNEIQHIFGAGFQSVQTMTNFIHFNKDRPEFSNVFINDLKNKYATIYDGEIAKIVSRKDLVNSMYNRNKNYIEDNMGRFIEKLRPSQKKALERWLEIDDDDDERILRIKNELDMSMYTNRAIPKSVMKEILTKN